MACLAATDDEDAEVGFSGKSAHGWSVSVRSAHRVQIAPKLISPGPGRDSVNPENSTSDRLGITAVVGMERDASLPRSSVEPDADPKVKAAIAVDPEARARAVDTASQFAIEHRGAGLAALTADAMALAVAAVGAAGVETLLNVHTTVHAQSFHFSTTLIRLFVSVPLMALLLAGSRAGWRLRNTVGGQLAATTPAIAAGGLISLAGWSLISDANLVQAPPSDAILIMCALGILTVAVTRLAHHAAPLGAGGRTRRVVIVGSGLVAARVTEEFNASGGVEVIGFVDDDPMDPTGWLGKLRDLAFVCERDGVDHVVVAFSRSRPEDLIEALRPVQGRVAITVVPRLFDVLPATANMHDLGSGLTGISVAPVSFGWGSRVAKRSIDVVGATMALLLLSPLLLTLALAIKATSKGPVVFRQTRVGKNNQAFSMLKLRSMKIERSVPHPAAGQAVTGPFPKLKDDPRVTSVGRILRRTSLDELPQLWNVLLGEMSLVGPRPFVPADDAWITDWAQRRYSVRPGITGLWQVSGRNNLTFEEMCRLDNLYVSCWSASLDIRILLRTLRAMAGGSGAY
jgi:exopolysaccharide biosynthesis polyprenyl glycosylphosphotransferase